jgi:hypothetical protein
MGRFHYFEALAWQDTKKSPHRTLSKAWNRLVLLQDLIIIATLIRG